MYFRKEKKTFKLCVRYRIEHISPNASHPVYLLSSLQPSTVVDSTRVLVMDQGRVVEFAPPSTLLADPDSVFHGMARDAGLV